MSNRSRYFHPYATLSNNFQPMYADEPIAEEEKEPQSPIQSTEGRFFSNGTKKMRLTIRNDQNEPVFKRARERLSVGGSFLRAYKKTNLERSLDIDFERLTHSPLAPFPKQAMTPATTSDSAGSFKKSSTKSAEPSETSLILHNMTAPEDTESISYSPLDSIEASSPRPLSTIVHPPSLSSSLANENENADETLPDFGNPPEFEGSYEQNELNSPVCSSQQLASDPFAQRMDAMDDEILPRGGEHFDEGQQEDHLEVVATSDIGSQSSSVYSVDSISNDLKTFQLKRTRKIETKRPDFRSFQERVEYQSNQSIQSSMKASSETVFQEQDSCSSSTVVQAVDQFHIPSSVATSSSTLDEAPASVRLLQAATTTSYTDYLSIVDESLNILNMAIDVIETMDDMLDRVVAQQILPPEPATELIEIDSATSEPSQQHSANKKKETPFGSQSSSSSFSSVKISQASQSSDVFARIMKPLDDMIRERNTNRSAATALAHIEPLTDHPARGHLIVSEKVYKNSLLTHLFEHDLDMQVHERDYSSVRNEYGLAPGSICDVDILLDELNGLILLNMNEINRAVSSTVDEEKDDDQDGDDDQMDPLELFEQIQQLKYKLRHLFVIFVPFKRRVQSATSSRPPSLNKRQKVDKQPIKDALNSLNQKPEWVEFFSKCLQVNKQSSTEHVYSVKLLFLSDLDGLGETVTALWQSKPPSRLSTIPLSISRLELVLLSCNCLNSYSIHRILDKNSLDSLIALYTEQQSQPAIEEFLATRLSKEVFVQMLHQLANLRQNVPDWP